MRAPSPSWKAQLQREFHHPQQFALPCCWAAFIALHDTTLRTTLSMHVWGLAPLSERFAAAVAGRAVLALLSPPMAASDPLPLRHHFEFFVDPSRCTLACWFRSVCACEILCVS